MRSCCAYHPTQFGIFSLKFFIRLPAHPPGHGDDPEALLPRAAARGWGGVSVRLRWFRLSQRETQGLHRYSILFLYPRTITENTKPLDYSWIKQQFSISKVILQYSQKKLAYSILMSEVKFSKCLFFARRL